MPVEILKASVGDYSVNRSGRGVTVNQKYLGEPGDWAEVGPVHQWYLRNPNATVAEVAEQLDQMPEVIEVRGYKVYISDLGSLCVVDLKGAHQNPSRYKNGTGDPCIQYLRKHYNGNRSTDVAECARLIEEYFDPKELVVKGYQVYKEMGEVRVRLPGETGFWIPGVAKDFRDTNPVLAHLRKHTTPATTVRETAKLIEEYQEPVTVKGCTVAKSANGTTVTGAGYSLSKYLSDHNYAGKSVAEVAKLIEDFVEPIKITVESGNEKHTFHTANDAVGYLQSMSDMLHFISTNLGDGWYYTGFCGFGVLFNSITQVVKKCTSIEEAKRFTQDQEVPF